LLVSLRSHRRVAFPLPGVPLKFQWVRGRGYPERPGTFGGHLRKRRRECGLLQREVAAKLGVVASTYLLWERDRSKPTVGYYPAIFSFLGYEPFPEPTTLPERIAAQRRRLGRTIKEASSAIGVDEGTFHRWETGEWKPRMSEEAVRRFLALPVPDRALNLES
jgi:DNA-binding XRE family transcriptional regulator